MSALPLGDAVMLAVAKRIAQLATAGNGEEAARQYKHHLSEMDAQEQAEFTNAVVMFRIEVSQ